MFGQLFVFFVPVSFQCIHEFSRYGTSSFPKECEGEVPSPSPRPCYEFPPDSVKRAEWKQLIFCAHEYGLSTAGCWTPGATHLPRLLIIWRRHKCMALYVFFFSLSLSLRHSLGNPISALLFSLILYLKHWFVLFRSVETCSILISTSANSQQVVLYLLPSYVC